MWVYQKSLLRYLTQRYTMPIPQAKAALTDIAEDMAAEQKARSTYEYLIHLSDDPEVTRTLWFLWPTRIADYQRFGEILHLVQDHYQHQRYFAMPGLGADNIVKSEWRPEGAENRSRGPA